MPLTYASVAPGTVTDRRPVPSTIARPEYVDKPAPEKYTGSEVKDAETIEKMRVACRIAAQAMQEAAKVIAPGVTTDEIDRVGHEFLLDHGAYPSTLGYRSFPKSLCTSVNEVICHGIPDSRRLEDGDIVNIDITGYIGGSTVTPTRRTSAATSTRSRGCWSSAPTRPRCAASRRRCPGGRSTSSAG